PRDRFDPLPGQARAEPFRHRPAQPRLADVERRDPAADDERREAAAGGFDFGELRHRTRELTSPIGGPPAAPPDRDAAGQTYSRGTATCAPNRGPILLRPGDPDIAAPYVNRRLGASSGVRI